MRSGVRLARRVFDRAGLRLVLLVLLGLLGAPSQAEEPAGVVAFAQDDLSNDWRRAQVEEVAEALARYPGVEFRVSDARGRLPLQVLQVEEWIDAGVDVLITSPMDAEAMAPVLRRAREAGVPLVLLDRRASEPVEDALVVGDNRGIGRAAGRAVVDAIGGRGRVLMLEGVSGATSTRDRRDGFMNVMSGREAIEITRVVGNYLRGDTIRVIEELIAERGGFPFDAVFAQSDSMATGLRMALRRHDIDIDPIFIVGVDYIAEAREAIRAGEQDMSFTYPTGGEEGAALAIDLLRGDPVPAESIKAFETVTPANVEDMEPIF